MRNTSNKTTLSSKIETNFPKFALKRLVKKLEGVIWRYLEANFKGMPDLNIEDRDFRKTIKAIRKQERKDFEKESQDNWAGFWKTIVNYVSGYPYHRLENIEFLEAYRRLLEWDLNYLEKYLSCLRNSNLDDTFLSALEENLYSVVSEAKEQSKLCLIKLMWLCTNSYETKNEMGLTGFLGPLGKSDLSDDIKTSILNNTKITSRGLTLSLSRYVDTKIQDSQKCRADECEVEEIKADELKEIIKLQNKDMAIWRNLIDILGVDDEEAPTDKEFSKILRGFRENTDGKYHINLETFRINQI